MLHVSSNVMLSHQLFQHCQLIALINQDWNRVSITDPDDPLTWIVSNLGQAQI